jgi:hypothetical protein
MVVKRLLIGISAALFFCSSVIDMDTSPFFNKQECTFKGIPLYGKVKVVTAFPDIKVEVVTAFPDLQVKVKQSFPDKCGEWMFVESFPDFTIEYVESFPDISIEYID